MSDPRTMNSSDRNRPCGGTLRLRPLWRLIGDHFEFPVSPIRAPVRSCLDGRKRFANLLGTAGGRMMAPDYVPTRIGNALRPFRIGLQEPMRIEYLFRMALDRTRFVDKSEIAQSAARLAHEHGPQGGDLEE